MNVPTKMTPPRQQIHQQFCLSATCRFRTKAHAINPQCMKLDELLDFNDEMVLHDKAREFEAEVERVSTKRHGVGIGAGLLCAGEMTDPYVKIEAFDEDPETHVHPGEERPDCPSCVAGKEHYHRKSDGSPVKALTAEEDGA